MEKTVEVLRKLVRIAERFWLEDGLEDDFAEAMVEGSKHLEELEEMTWDYEIFVIACRPDACKVRSGQLYFDKRHARTVCDMINERCQTGDHWKVYRGIINLNKEALVNADLRI